MNQDEDEYVGYHRLNAAVTVEVFWEVDEGKEGWYWWQREPGELASTNANGPYATSTSAYDAALRRWDQSSPVSL